MLKSMISAVDTHTMGEPTRVITSGIKVISEATMVEKKNYAARQLDNIRKALMQEPRGHREMFGSIIVEPSNPLADFGVIFMDGGGYLDMCGHGLIGTITVALETGIIERYKSGKLITIDTPAGLIYATAEFNRGSVLSVSFRNVPSFLYQQAVPVKLEGREGFLTDIAYGGNYFALVEASELGLKIESGNSSKISNLGMRILNNLQKSIAIKHPLSNEAQQVNLVEFCDAGGLDGSHGRNTVVFGNGQIDRSPCGTGTCAKMAALYTKGKLKLGEAFIHESIIGTTFQGRLLKEVKVGSIRAVIPEITARAFIIGFQKFQIHPDDPLKYGFCL